MRQQLVCGQIAWLTAVEDGLGDVRGEIAEADEPRKIGWADALPLGKGGKRHTIAVEECGIESARPDQQLDQPCISSIPKRLSGAGAQPAFQRFAWLVAVDAVGDRT